MAADQSTRVLGPAASLAVVLAISATVAGQAPVQFRSDLRVRDLDGNNGTAKLYVGASKLRMEFVVDGETRPTIVEPREQTQFTISPSQKKYVEMSHGESGGTVRIPRLFTLNPSNPCSNEQLSECKRLGPETVNGYATEKWEYTNVDGDRETAWIATKLRFPIRTTAGKATSEITNVVEGPQPANLFEIPSGYAQVDDLGGGSGGIGDVDPAMLQKAMEMAKAMAAASGAGGVNSGAPMTGSNPASSRYAIWERGLGYVVNLTVTVRGAEQGRTPLGAQGESRATTTARYTASFPLNHGTQAVDYGSAARSIGPMWTLLNAAGSGIKEAEARPITYSMDWRRESTEHVNWGCERDFVSGNSTTTTITTHKAQATTSLAKPSIDLVPQGLIRLNGALTTYELVAGIGGHAMGEKVTNSKIVDHCAGEKVTTETKTEKEGILPLSFELKDLPLPATPAAWKGTKTVPWNRDGAQTATLEWSIVPVEAR